ncbi:MAG: hypothetical protein IPF84_06540 [Proteobacteria bacterium]|nr:hypothetical protein [Pseudomonadota bacterium]
MSGIRRLASALALSTLLVALAGPLTAGAQEAAAAPPTTAADAAAVEPAIPNSKCFNCHDDAEMKDEAGKSVAVHEAQFAVSAHKKLDCVGCHTAALGVKHKGKRQPLGPVSFDVCMECHEDEITPFQGSVHARVKGGKPGTCEGCHGNVHTFVRSNNPAAAMAPLNQVRNCGVCHEDMMEGYLSSVHARSLFVSGLTDAAPSCSDCHGSHDIQRHDAAGARTSHKMSPETCGDCHKGILKEWDESAHGALWRDGKDGPVCSTCHEAHAIQDPTTAAMRTHMPSDCGNCHEELYKSFHDSFHGKASAVGHGSAAMCSDCHTPHHNLPASDPRSSTHPDNLAATCGASSCHAGKVNASFLTFIPHSDPMDRDQNAWVHYIYLFMTLLLLGVFGFFGLHALLWLQRTLVGRLRGEFKVEHFGPGPYVRRFTTTQMWLHVDHPELPAALGDRPAAQVRGGALGAGPDGGAGRARDRGLPASLRGDRHFRLFRRAPGDAVPRRSAQARERLFLGLALDDAEPQGRPGPVGEREVLPVPRTAPGARSLGVLGKVRLSRGLLGRRHDRRLGPDPVVPGLLHAVPAGLGTECRLHHPQ